MNNTKSKKYNMLGLKSLFRIKWLAKMTTIVVVLSFILPCLSWTFENHSFNLNYNNSHFNQLKNVLQNEHGKIRHAFTGRDRLIVHIQDLHCNQEVQLNIANMIKDLASHHQLKMIAVEGAHGRIITDKLATFPNEQVKQSVGQRFIKEGKITGPEYITALSSQPLILEGIENHDYYIESRKRIINFLNDESLGLVFDLKDTLTVLKDSIYSTPLKLHDQHVTNFQEGRTTLQQYGATLYRAALKSTIDLQSYKQIKKFISRRTNIFPVEIDRQLLYEQLDKLELALRETIYSHEKEKALDQQLSRLSTIEKLINISATPDELEHYLTHPQLYNIQQFQSFLNSYGDRKTTLRIDPEVYRLDWYLNQVKAFYELADKRSLAFVDNTLARMDTHQTKMAVLVTGGFHTELILKQLQQKGISYLSVEPSLTNLDTINPYFALMQDKKTTIEKLLAKNQNIISLTTSFPQEIFVQGIIKKTVSTNELIFLKLLDITLKQDLIANLILHGAHELDKVASEFEAVVSEYQENNARILIDWNNALANRNLQTYMLPLLNTGFTIMIRPRALHFPGESLVTWRLNDDLDLAIMETVSAQEARISLLAQSEQLVGGDPVRDILLTSPLPSLVSNSAALMIGSPMSRFWFDQLKHQINTISDQTKSMLKQLWHLGIQWFDNLRQIIVSNYTSAKTNQLLHIDSPALSVANVLLSGSVFTLLTMQSDRWYLSVIVAIIFGIQLSLILAMWARFNTAQGPDHKQSFINWFVLSRGGKIADAHTGIIYDDYRYWANWFTRDWFAWHELIERMLPLRFIPLFGNTLNHLVASALDWLGALMAALLWGINVSRDNRLANKQHFSITFKRTYNEEALAIAAAEHFSKQVNQLIAAHGKAVIGLATGSTPEGMYKLLIENQEHYKIDWSKVHTFNLDEYIGLAPGHPQSYRYYMQKKLFDHVDIPSENIHFLNGQAEDIVAEAQRYEKEIKSLGGLDFQVLGIGPNGHLAFNEPGSSFNSRTRKIKLTSSTLKANSIYFINNTNEQPQTALTMGMGTILEAKELMLLASGPKKAVALADALTRSVSQRVPASALQLHNQATVIADNDAAINLNQVRITKDRNNSSLHSMSEIMYFWRIVFTSIQTSFKQWHDAKYDSSRLLHFDSMKISHYWIIMLLGPALLVYSPLNIYPLSWSFLFIHYLLIMISISLLSHYDLFDSPFYDSTPRNDYPFNSKIIHKRKKIRSQLDDIIRQVTNMQESNKYIDFFIKLTINTLEPIMPFLMPIIVHSSPTAKSIEVLLYKIPNKDRATVFAQFENLFKHFRLKTDDIPHNWNNLNQLPPKVQKKVDHLATAIKRRVSAANENELKGLSTQEQSLFRVWLILTLFYHYENELTFPHLWNLGNLTAEVADDYHREHPQLLWSHDQKEIYRIAGWLHDMGKLIIPLEALTYSGTDEKRDYFRTIIRLHALISPTLLSAFGFSEEIIAGTDHHERMDGKGILGKAKDELSLLAKIMIVTDATEAMLANRFYRRTQKDVLTVIQELFGYADKDGEYRYDLETVGAVDKTLNKYISRNLFLQRIPTHWFMFDRIRALIYHLIYRTNGWLRLSHLAILAEGIVFAFIASILAFWILPDPSLPSVVMLSMSSGLLSIGIQLPRLISRSLIHDKQGRPLTHQQLDSQSHIWLNNLQNRHGLPKEFNANKIKFVLLPDSSPSRWWQSIKLGHGGQEQDGYVVHVHPFIHRLPMILQLAVIRHELWEAYYGSHLKATFFELTYFWKAWFNSWRSAQALRLTNKTIQPIQDNEKHARPEEFVDINDVILFQQKLSPIIARANERYRPTTNRLTKLITVLKQSSNKALVMVQVYQLINTMALNIITVYQSRNHEKPRPVLRRFRRAFGNAA